ncbi:MAG: PfkB family carbohydrate kinase [Kiritimatiellales bacterium]
MSFCVIGIGEVLWDVFPTHRRLGGAPYNYAFHCRQMSADAAIASCVGRDDPGFEIQQCAEESGLDVSCLQEVSGAPTGTVQVRLESGKPSYEICPDAAWDHLAFTAELSHLTARADAICFGTLGQRNRQSREVIGTAVRNCPETALKIFDVNLRQEFFSKEVIQDSLQLANILKVSDEELPVLKTMFGLTGEVPDQLRQLIDRFSFRLAAYTRGPNGSLLVLADTLSDHGGCEGAAVDSVGAGDAFTAALCMGLLQEWSLDEINEYSNRVATFVCSQKGATPILPSELIQGVPSYA